MPLDIAERDRIREQYAGQPGVGHLVEQAATALGNSRDLGADTEAEANLRRLGFLGYEPAEARDRREADREEAGRRRKEAAEAGEDGAERGEDAPADKPPPATSPPKRATRSRSGDGAKG